MGELTVELPPSVSARERVGPVAAADLKERTVRGGVAKIAAQALGFVMRIGSLMVLARLLDPKDFGLVAMVTVVTGIFALFKDAGLSMATIQRDEISHQQVSALFWINVAVGLALAVMTVALGPVLVRFYQEPRLMPIAFALAVGFVLSAVGVQHSALLQRHMRFTALAAIEIVAQLASSAIGIGMAFAGYGYWALVYMALVLPAASTAGFWIAAKWSPGLPAWPRDIAAMVGMGGKVSLNVFIVYVAYNMDKVLLGRLAGAEILGLYGRAYQLINIPTENLNAAVGGVALAALSRLQDDGARFKSYFLKGYSLVLALTIPVTVACALFADEIVRVLLGPKWTEAASIFRLLTPTILAFALINPVTWLLFSTGKVGRSLRMSFVIAPVVVAAAVIGVAYGARGVALGYSAAMGLLALPMIAWAIYDSVVSPRDLWNAPTPPVVAAIAGTIAAVVARFVFGATASPLVNLLLFCGLLFAVYGWTLVFAMGQRAFYMDLVRDLRGRG